jgi:phosphate transport system permease protein
MNLLIFALILTTALAVFFSRHLKKLRSQAPRNLRFSSLPAHYNYCLVLWLIIIAASLILSPLTELKKYFLFTLFSGAVFFLALFLYHKNFNAQKHLEKFGIGLLSITALIGILITGAIALSIFFEAFRFFDIVKLGDFFFGTSWNPQVAITADQDVGTSSFGIIPVFLGTLLITLIAIAISVPFGIMSAIYLCFYAKKETRDLLKPALEILAGIPTVVYGYFAVTSIAPFFSNFFALFNIPIASESALGAGFVMGIMIIPFILSLTDDALNSVPKSLEDASLAMGSTKSEMIKKVAIPSAMPSIIGAVILAVSRAIGETMIVTMAAGLVANLTFNPLNSVTTATAQIVMLLVGDQEFDSPKTLAAFALALTLFIFTFIFNIVALAVIKSYKRKYS